MTLVRNLTLQAMLFAVIILLTACGGVPLAAPEAEQVAQPPATRRPTPTTRVTRGPISPIATPQNDNPVPTPIVSATQEPADESEGSQPTPQLIILTPVTPSLSYEEVLKEGEVTVGGYTFSLPQEVPDGRGPVEIIGWLPDSPDEIIDTRNRQIVAINMNTGQIREFSKPFDRRLTLPSIKLLKNDKVAFTPDLGEGQKIGLWISGADDKQTTAPTVPEIRSPAILAPDSESLLIFDSDIQQLNLLEADGTTRQSSSVAQPLEQLVAQAQQSSEQQTLSLYSVTSPTSGWTALYGLEHFSLFNLNTGETKALTLIPERKGEYEFQVETVYWSPNGEKVAVLASNGPRPILFMKLFVGEAENGQLREIVTGFQYVTNATWAPDSVNLLISADTGVAEAEAGYEYKTSSLFLLNLSSNKLTFLPLLSEGSAIDFIWDLSWAPDGQAIALSAVLSKPGNPQLYRIDVDTR